MRPLFRLTSAILLAALLGCSPGLGQPIPTPPSRTVGATSPPTDPATPPPAPDGAGDLVLWIPPQFDPAADNPAAARLQEQLQAFAQERPNLEIEVRLKAESGPGGLLETLRAASTAAPGALPDLVLLDPAGLNTAALKDLIVPLTGILEPPSEADWHPHSRAAAHIDGEFYGYPFASDAIILAYRPGAYETPPLAWSTMLESDRRFLFPAGDPQALFTLAQYEATGGTFVGDSGLPSLDPTTLAEVLSFYSSLRKAGILPIDALEFETEAQAWNALLDGRVHSAVSPLSGHLRTAGQQLISAAPLITRDGTGISMARTWSWAMVAQEPEQQELAAELIRWLHEPEFLGQWTELTGLIPPTTTALDSWPEGKAASVATLLAHTLRPRPSEETLATFGPSMQAAVRAVLAEGVSPETASFEAARDIEIP